MGSELPKGAQEQGAGAGGPRQPRGGRECALCAELPAAGPGPVCLAEALSCGIYFTR